MKKPFQFKIAALLFVVTLVAGYFAGHYWGFEAGKNEWTKLPTYFKTYNIQAIVLTDDDFEQSLSGPGPHFGGISIQDYSNIIERIKTDVFPNAWLYDPNAKLQPYPAQLSIVVQGNGALHHEVERYLAVAIQDAENGIVDYQVPDN